MATLVTAQKTYCPMSSATSRDDFRRGLLDNEVPLRSNLKLHIESAMRLGLTGRASGPPRGCIVANAALAACRGPDTWIFYSRDHNHYANVRPSVPVWYTCKNIVDAVAALVAEGLIEEVRTAPSPNARHRSRFRATPALTRAIGPEHVSNLQWESPPAVILRSRDDRRVLDPRVTLCADDLLEVERIAADVVAQNQCLARHEVRLIGGGAQELSSGLIALGDFRLNPAQRHYFRVFNGDLAHGGRWYGPWWQGIPSAARTGVTIDGKSTIELDYSACQLRLMFAQLGMPDPLGGAIRPTDPGCDLYRIDGLDRGVVKLALLIMINAADFREACAALASSQQASHPASARREAARILRAVANHYPALNNLWFTAIGLRMQRLDSDICADVQRRMRARGLPALSVHDSFIAWSHAELSLRSDMATALTPSLQHSSGHASTEAVPLLTCKPRKPFSSYSRIYPHVAINVPFALPTQHTAFVLG